MPQGGTSEIVPFVDLAAQYPAIQAEVEAALRDVFQHCDFILGQAVEAFEAAFARFIGVDHAVGVSNGLDALCLSLRALNIGPGDEVLLPANTYIATALAVSAVGARPVLVDCDPHTFEMDVTGIDAVINGRTRAMIPVHLAGQAADMTALLALAERHGVEVIEDAAQAHGTRYAGAPVGGLGTVGCFSFYPGKNLGAYGDGGMITTRDAALAARLRQLRNYGQRVKYEHVEKGVNARLDSLQAAILSVKLRHLPAWNQAREQHARAYMSLLHGIGDIQFQATVPDSSHVYHLLTIVSDHRDALQTHLTAAGIQTGIHYPIPIHLQPAYGDLGYRRGDFPHTEHLADRMLSLPMFPELQEHQLKRVAHAIETFFI
jgi:dTDP-4-amino-4,6-dideoxygalactose transaminase